MTALLPRLRPRRRVTEPPVPPPARRRRRGDTADTAAALGVWLGSRLGLALVVLLAARLLTGAPGFLQLWDRWDVGLFEKIARYGYFRTGTDYADCCTEAFFPGEPLVLRTVHLLVPSWLAAGLLVSLVAGGIACVALVRLERLELGRTGWLVPLWVFSPYAVFLAAGYSEALFCACAFPGWLAARRGRWAAAGVLVGLAAAVRITGLFLAVALAVEYAVARRRAGLPLLAPAAGWLLVPFAVVAAYFGWLWARTGDVFAWQHAQLTGWHRGTAWPWDALANTLRGVTAPGQDAGFAISWIGDIAAVAVGVVAVVLLLRLRRWAEAVYVGLNVLALGTSSYYQSIARATLLWFPLWLLCARGAARWRWFGPALLSVMAPLSVLFVVVFTHAPRIWVD